MCLNFLPKGDIFDFSLRWEVRVSSEAEKTLLRKQYENPSRFRLILSIPAITAPIVIKKMEANCVEERGFFFGSLDEETKLNARPSM